MARVDVRLLGAVDARPAPNAVTTRAAVLAPNVTATSSGGGTLITHGDQINASNVGPAAFGYTNLTATTGQSLTTTTNPSTLPWIQVLSSPRVVALPDGTTYTIPAGDWLVEGFKFSAGFSVSRSGVHFLGCEFSCSGATGWALFPRTGGFTRFSFIGGSMHAPTSTGSLQFGLNASGDYSNISVLFSELYWVADAILINGNTQDVRGNYGHDLINFDGHQHNDFYQAHGGQQHISITLNHWDNPLGQTSCVALFQDNVAGGNHYNDVTVSKNLMAGGGYCVYGGAGGSSDPQDSITNMTFDSNKFSTVHYPTGGQFGTHTEFNATEETWSNNTWADGPNVGQPA